MKFNRRKNILLKKKISKLFTCLDSLSSGLTLLNTSSFVPVKADKATYKKKKKGGKLENGYHLVVPPIK